MAQDTPLYCTKCYQTVTKNGACPKGDNHHLISMSDKGVQGQGNSEGPESDKNSKPSDPSEYSHKNKPVEKTAGGLEMSNGSSGKRWRVNCSDCGHTGQWSTDKSKISKEEREHYHNTEHDDSLRRLRSTKVAPDFHPIREAALRFVAHDSGDGETVFHCPFCGSGQVLGGSDGTIECNFCKSCFTVQVQPEQMGMPQTVNGIPYQMPGMPYGESSTGDPMQTDPGAAGIGADEEPPQDPGEQDPDGSDLGSPQDEEDQDASKDSAPWMRESSLYITSEGVLSGDDYLKHLALMYSDNRESTIQEVRNV